MQAKKTNGLRAAIYARRTIDSDKSDSIQMQIEVCQNHLNVMRPGDIESITVYCDEGYTRRNTNRPDWERMMSDIDNGLLDLVCVYKIDRISGNMRDFSLFYTKLVDDLDMQIISVREGIDSSLPLIGEVMAYISAMMSTYEVKQDSIRSYDNARSLAVHGFWTGGVAPVGYTTVPVTVNGKVHKVLEPVPELIEYKDNLISIFLDNNFTLSGMEGYLRKNGIKTRRGKFFSTTQIYSLFTSPQCVANTQLMYDYFVGKGCEIEQEFSSREKWDGTHGIIIFGRTSERKQKHVLNPPDKWLVCIGRHKPYMSDERYFQIINQLSGNTFDKTSKFPPTLLKGVLRCSCGSVMRISRKRKVDGSYSAWYYCLKRMRQGSEFCQRSQIKTELLDNQVLDVFKNIQSDPAAIEKYVKVANPKSKKRSVSSLRMHIRNNEEKLERLAGTLATNNDSTATKYIINEMERLDMELNNYKKDLLIASAEEVHASAARQDLKKKRDEICNLMNNFNQFSMEERNQIAKDVLKECIWDGDTLTITL